MVGLVLGVVRFPVVMSVKTSVSIIAGTNLGVSTLGAITAAIHHYNQKNIQFRAFIFLATTGAARLWLILYKLCPYISFAYDNWFNCVIRIICIA